MIEATLYLAVLHFLAYQSLFDTTLNTCHTILSNEIDKLRYSKSCILKESVEEYIISNMQYIIMIMIINN